MKPIRYGSIWPANHIFANAEEGLGRKLLAYSIPLTIHRYTDEGDMMSDLLGGNLEIASTSVIQSRVPETSLMYLPYLYRNLAHFHKVWTLNANPVARQIERLIKQKTMLEPLGYSIIGVRDCILVDTPIITLDDFAGVPFRVDGAAVSVQIFKALGAAPKTVDFYDVAAALKSRSVLAAENAAFNMLALGWHKHCKFVTRTEHRFLINYELAAPEFWAALRPAAKASLRGVFREYLSYFATVSRRGRQASLKTLGASEGMKVNTITAKQRSAFRSATQCVIDSFAETHGLSRQIEWIRNA